MLLRSLGIFVIVSSLGCSLDRLAFGPEGQRDASITIDAAEPGSDAGPELDAGERLDADGPRLDAGERDAAIDAFVPRDGGPCGTGPDSDGDGVPDACDVCASGDDALDADADGIADGCDDWPCGTEPSVPASVSGEEITLSNVSIDGGGNTAVVRRGLEYDLAFSFEIDDTACGGCRDQIEIGTEPGGRLFCAYDANPPGDGARGDRTRTLTAPSATGLVDLRFNLGQNYGCEFEGADEWWEIPPPAELTFGVLCVVP